MSLFFTLEFVELVELADFNFRSFNKFLYFTLEFVEVVEVAEFANFYYINFSMSL